MKARRTQGAPVPVLLCSGLLAVSFAAITWATRVWPDTPDGLFHLHRVRGLAEALHEGVFYPRWFPDFAFGHGYPVLHYYSPAFYYPPALLHLAGVDLILATRLAAAATYALSGGAMLALLRRWTGWGAALFGAVLYLAYPYRFYDLFVRGALPEFAAFVWLPLIVLGGCATVAAAESQPLDGVTVRGRERTLSVPLGAGALLLSLAVAGVVLTHNLTALMAVLAGATGGFTVLIASQAGNQTKTGQASKPGWRASTWTATALAIGVLLSAPYALPALWDAQWVGIGASPPGSGFANHLATWRSLWTWEAVYPYPTAAEPLVVVPAYVLILLALAAAALTRIGAPRVHLVTAAVVTLVALWLMTESSEPIWRAAPAVLGRLQFPWRWQSILALSVAALGALLAESGGKRLATSRLASRAYWVAVGAAGVYVVVYSLAALPSSSLPVESGEVTREQMWAFDAQHGQVGATWTGEFLPIWVSAPVWAIGRELDSQEAAPPADAVEFGVQVAEEGYLQSRYRIVAPNPLTVTLQTFYFPAWNVRVDGAGVESSPGTSLGLLSFPVPAGEHAVEVAWSPTPALALGRLAFAAGWLAVLSLLWSLGAGKRRALVAVWAALAMLFVVAAGGWTERMDAVHGIKADYGAVDLIGASSQETAAGETARVRLHWSVSAPTEVLTAFVHVVDGEGRVAAQNDGPLGGAHFPPSRWTPGMVFHQDHLIAIPPEMAPGRYRLLAGLYWPGAADAPLVASGQEGPRVEVGVLEVR